MDDTIVIYDFIVFEKPDSVKKYNKKWEISKYEIFEKVNLDKDRQRCWFHLIFNRFRHLKKGVIKKKYKELNGLNVFLPLR